MNTRKTTGADETPASVALKMGLSEDERKAIRDELTAHGESPTIDAVRSRLKEERAGLVAAYWSTDSAPPNRREALAVLLADNRAALDSLSSEVRFILDARHAEHMASLSEASNRIARQSHHQAVALKWATWALVVVTAALIVATTFSAAS